MTPNKERIKLWVDALRSGKYKQTVGQLRNLNPELTVNGKARPVGYCCLGVACEVAIDNGITFVEYGDLDWGGWLALPPQVAEWLGLYDDDGELAAFPTISDEPAAWGEKTWESQKFTRADIANDELHWSFAQIADAVEKKYLTDIEEEA